MKIRHLLPLAALALLLTACGNTGPLPTFGKAIVPQWITADFDGQPGDEYVATSILEDVVFNARGEVIGWYVKQTAGTPFITRRADGTYNFDALKNSRTVVNMVGGAAQNGTAQGNAQNGSTPPNAFPANRRAFAVTGGPLDPAAAAQTQAPTLKTDLGANEQTAVFRYTQGGATVTKTVTLHPRNFKIDLQTQVTGGPAQVSILFPGLGKADNPRVQAVPQGGEPSAVQGSGSSSVQNIQYAALQEKPSQIAHALIVRPQGGTTASATLTGGAQGLISAQVPATSNLEVYGGKNELIHLYQSGYTSLPGLFQPNIFGQISLLIVKLMELLYKVIGNWGLVIVALTVLIRIVIWPLMQAQGRTTARMQFMQPLIKEIQDRYKDKKDVDSQRAMQAEMSQLYRDHNFNPAGCLSTLLPLPVLIALWSTVRNFEFDKGFLWLPDLAIPDPFYILALLYMVANLGQLYVATRKSPEMFRQQAIIYLVFLYFALTFPAGVTIYTILSTLIGIGQQILINRQVARETATLSSKQSVQKVSGPANTSGTAKPAAGKTKNTAATANKITSPKKTLDAPKE